MEFLSKLNNDPRVVSAVLIILFAVTLIVKYRKHLYYGFDDQRFQTNILNSKYRLNMKREVVDVNKINKQLFSVELIVLAISGLLMFIINSIVGLVAFVIISKIAVYVVLEKIGKNYSKIKVDNRDKAKKHKKNKKKKR